MVEHPHKIFEVNIYCGHILCTLSCEQSGCVVMLGGWSHCENQSEDNCTAEHFMQYSFSNFYMRTQFQIMPIFTLH